MSKNVLSGLALQKHFCLVIRLKILFFISQIEDISLSWVNDSLSGESFLFHLQILIWVKLSYLIGNTFFKEKKEQEMRLSM